MTKHKIGIIGVGLMGHGIALNIQKKGWPIALLDHPGNQPVDDLKNAGARICGSYRELSEHSDTLILCVTGSAQIEEILSGESGLLTELRPGSTIIDCSTAIPDSTHRMAALTQKAGSAFLDAPMTRTPREAAQGKLNLIVGADAADYERLLPLMQCFAENITHVGPVGAGHTMKLVHNYVSLGYSAVLAEAIATSRRAGIDAAAFQQVLANGGGAGIVLDRMMPYVLDKDLDSFSFSLANSFKDINYYNLMCDNLEADATIASAVRETYKKPVDDGEGDQFVPQIIDRLSK